LASDVSGVLQVHRRGGRPVRVVHLLERLQGREDGVLLVVTQACGEVAHHLRIQCRERPRKGPRQQLEVRIRGKALLHVRRLAVQHLESYRLSEGHLLVDEALAQQLRQATGQRLRT